MKKQVLEFLLAIMAGMILLIVIMLWYLYRKPSDPDRASDEPSSSVQAPVRDATGDVAEKDAKQAAVVEFPGASSRTYPDSFPVVNCATAKENLLRQREDMSLELIDHNGKSLWNIPFPGKLRGSVVQVDFYSNRKIQFMVADSRKVHLIDRLGRPVKTFPRTMPEEIVFGPEEIMNHGVKYYKLQTKTGALYFTLADSKILTELPE